MFLPWHIELLGHLRAYRDSREITRFESRKTAALLAFLALRSDCRHAREELVERLWPEADPEAGRNRLKQSLASLRRQLEPPGIPAGGVLVADRSSIGLNPEAVTTDAAAFEAALEAAERAAVPPEAARLLTEAVEAYRGELLPGYYEDWILAERQRLADRYLAALHRLLILAEQAADGTRAVQVVHRILATDPLCEEAHAALMRLYLADSRPADALEQYRLWERLLTEHLDSSPSESVQALARKAQAEASASPPSRLPHLQSRAQAGEETRDRQSKPPSPGAAIPFPPNFPLHITRFFGREEELSRLRDLLTPAAHSLRLLTLTGPGGTGKTRLAVETARQLRPVFPGGIWFAPLADIAGGAHLPGAILEALRLPRASGVEPLDQAISFLQGAGGPHLIVLDNCEHLVAEAASVVRNLLECVPELRCLVTSRQVVGLEGEREFPLEPLPVPSLPGTPERLSEFAAVQIFVDRAQAARPDFQITPRNAGAVAQLCARLEGIPLALELAAAWAQTLSPGQMLEHLDHRFELLASRRRDAPLRQRTLRASIEWSYSLLPPELQRFFLRLSVFRGGWRLEDAAALCLEAPEPEGGALGLAAIHAALDSLTRLRECSLAQAEEAGEGMRFRMLETLREYAEERLSPDEAAELAARHAARYLHLAERAEPELRARRQAEWLLRLEREHDNLRAALAFSLEHAPAEGARLATALGNFWEVRGHLTEGRRWLERSLSAYPANDLLRARTLTCAGILATMQSDHIEAEERLTDAIALCREQGDGARLADALHALGVSAFYRNDLPRSQELHEEALALRRQSGEAGPLIPSLNVLGLLARRLHGDNARARVIFDEALRLARETGDRRTESYLLYNLASIAKESEQYERSTALLEESSAICRELGDLHFQAFLLNGAGSIAQMQGEDARALALYRECLPLCRRLGDRFTLVYAFWNLSELRLRRNDYRTATLFLAASSALMEALMMPPTEDDQEYLAHFEEEASAALGEERYRAAWRQGWEMPLDASIALAFQPVSEAGSAKPGESTGFL